MLPSEPRQDQSDDDGTDQARDEHAALPRLAQDDLTAARLFAGINWGFVVSPDHVEHL